MIALQFTQWHQGMHSMNLSVCLGEQSQRLQASNLTVPCILEMAPILGSSTTALQALRGADLAGKTALVTGRSVARPENESSCKLVSQR